MVGVITTNTVNSFKQQLLQGGHCFQASLTQTGNSHTSTLVDALTSTANLVVGMQVTSTANIAVNTYIAQIVNSTAVNISPAATGTGSLSFTFTADQFMLALIKFAPNANYNSTNTSNYSSLVANVDETAASGTYTAGGFALTNINPSVPDSNTAIATFTTNPSWTSATLDTAGALIYNKGIGGPGSNSVPRFGSVGNNAVSVHDFGGEQKVTAGTLTVTLPAANGSVGILRIA